MPALDQGRNEKSPLRALTHVLAKDREEYGASRNEKSPLRALTHSPHDASSQVVPQ